MDKPTCTIDGCERAVAARGWCRLHYHRWHRHGDPLHVTPWTPPPQNRPRTTGCSSGGCAAPHFAKGMCKSHYQQAYYVANRERLTQQQAANRATHQQRDADRARAWRDANPDQAKRNRDRYLRENAERLKDARRAYRAANRDLIRALNNRRKARLRNVAVNDLTGAEWVAIVVQYDGRCAYCGCTPDRITMDHVIPISKGGNHTASNVVPACGPCNFAKNDGPAPPFVVTPHSGT